MGKTKILEGKLQTASFILLVGAVAFLIYSVWASFLYPYIAKKFALSTPGTERSKAIEQAKKEGKKEYTIAPSVDVLNIISGGQK